MEDFFYKSAIMAVLKEFTAEGYRPIEVSERVASDDVEIKELVYELWPVRGIKVIVYTSVDKETERSREKNTDRIRFVVSAKMRGEYRYISYQWRNRFPIESMQTRVRETLQSIRANADDLRHRQGYTVYDSLQEALGVNPEQVNGSK